MRYLSFVVNSWLVLLFQSQTMPVLAATATFKSQVPSTSSSNGDFWQPAQKLIQEQIYLIRRIERAISEPEPNQVRAVRGQLFLHQSAVERFLKSQNPTPKYLCSSQTVANNGYVAGSNLGEPQLRVYCALYSSTERLATLRPVLERLLSRRGEIALVKPLPLVSGERQPHPVLGITTSQRPNLAVPSTPLINQAPNLPPPEPPIIGRTAKMPMSDYVPPMQPAIAPPQEAILTLEATRQILLSSETAFPAGTKFIDSKETAAILERHAYTVFPQEPGLYAGVLAMPQTGMARIMPVEVYRSSPNTLRSRLTPTVKERFPFTPLLPSREISSSPYQLSSDKNANLTVTSNPAESFSSEATSSFTPRLTLLVVNGNFQIAEPGLDYGFLADLGDVPMEKLDAKMKVVPSQTRQFFLQYQPPKELEALQVDRRRFLTGKERAFNLSQPLLSQVPAVLNHTYLVRSFQFQLPKIIENGEIVSRQNRRYLDQLLEMKSSDLIFAFRPVKQNSDGSYMVLWHVVNQLPNPKIEDLDRYVKFE